MYRLAAEKGHAEAQFLLGCALEFGCGIPKNKAEAKNWYQTAARQSNAAAVAALKNLGVG